MAEPEQSSLERPNTEELVKKIAELLVTGSLYKRYSYDSNQAHIVDQGSRQNTRFAILPKQFKLYCDHDNCGQDTIWETTHPAIYFLAQDFFHHAIYTCRNCGRKVIHYWFFWADDGQNRATFIKVGQYPPLSIEPSKELAAALGPEDTALYKKALINGNYSFGIGALAYFRRVIENKVNMLLDMIAEAAKLANFEPEELERIEEIKTSHHLDAKIEYASKILPPNLRPGGHNPLNKLYGVASTGIHGKSNAECLDDFQAARFEFQYLFKNLVVSNEEAKEYLKRVSTSAKKA
jgi:hypothetical protein